MPENPYQPPTEVNQRATYSRPSPRWFWYRFSFLLTVLCGLWLYAVFIDRFAPAWGVSHLPGIVFASIGLIFLALPFIACYYMARGLRGRPIASSDETRESQRDASTRG